MKNTIITLIIMLAACDARFETASSAGRLTAIPWPDGASFSPYLDLSLCRTRTDVSNVPQYDGEVWRLGASTEALRCPLPVSEQDYMMGWHVWGRHTSAGSAKTTACLQRMEVFMVEETPRHVNVEHDATLVCRSSVGATIGEFAILALMYAEPWHQVVDNTLSIEIRGNGQPGDIIGAAQVHIVRP